MISDFDELGILVCVTFIPYYYFRYTQALRDRFVREVNRLDLSNLVLKFSNDWMISPSKPFGEIFLWERSQLILDPIDPVVATTQDYARLIVSSASAFPLFDVFTRLCSDPRLPIEHDYCALFNDWYVSHFEEYIAQFSIEPISNESVWKSEAETRRIFEEIFNAKFPKSRPSWLKSSKGTSLELDGYNQDLKIAFEYQGEYHYMDVPIHQQGRTLAEIQRTDKLKEDLCQRRGITLIQVPYWEKGRKQFILEQLRSVGRLSAYKRFS